MEEQISQIEKYADQVIVIVVDKGPQVLLALLTLIVGLWIINRVVRTIDKQFKKRNMDPSLSGFLHSLISILFKALLFISVASMVGIEMTSFIAILGAAGLAVGLALQGTLQNFAGGVMLLLFKPFKVGDFVEMQGFMGVVSQIQIFHTVLKTVDNKTVIIPNSPISTGALINYSSEPTRRVDITFGIGYEDDIDKAKSVLARIIEGDDRILENPAPFIGVVELGDSSVNIVTRSWVNSGDYWGVYFDLMETVKKTFDQEGISIPFPQRDVHLHTQLGAKIGL